jgi:hypothetical protein
MTNRNAQAEVTGQPIWIVVNGEKALSAAEKLGNDRDASLC